MPGKKKVKHPLTFESMRVRQWILKNRGVLTHVAVVCGVVPQFVQQVAYGNSTALPGNPVERELRKRGWPGIRRKL